VPAFARILLTAGLLLGWCVAAIAQQQLVHFPSLNDNRPGQPPTMLDGYLLLPAGGGRHPAVVFLHGCGGLLRRYGEIQPRETAWAEELNRRGYAVLMVDSFGPRQQGSMCAHLNFNATVYRARPRDAYGALLFLQAQPFIRLNRIGVIGWSEGGGVVLLSIREILSLGRPGRLPQGDFRAAVAFYPASCDEHKQQAPWSSTIPLLVLVGANDVWTPAVPCKQLVENAIARGSPAEIQVYPGAYHDFDWPDMPVHESPQFRTAAGVDPIQGTDPAARQDAFERVPAFLDRHLTQ
jgi:dienelactone hydrolase